MILLYSLVLFALGMVRWLVVRRAASLARSYTKLATAVLKVVAQPLYKQGNANKADSFVMAKRQYELGRLVTQRDHLEGKQLGWQRWADKLTSAVGAVRGWKGFKLPYTLGVLDVWLVLYLIDHLGLGAHVSARQFVDMIVAWVQQ